MLKLPKLAKLPKPSAGLLMTGVLICVLTVYSGIVTQKLLSSQNEAVQLAATSQILNERIANLEAEDQRATNIQLAADIAQIKAAFKNSLTVYEELVELRLVAKSTAPQDAAFAEVLQLLADTNYASASTQLTQLGKDIASEKQKITAAAVAAIPVASAPINNTPPSSGYSRQTVKTDIGDYVVSLISADLGSTKVIVDTASDSNCGNDCPVMSLASYAARSGAYAGINGSYFCPAAYPSCAGKTNSFDLLVMNKNKTYFNSDNNVYSNNPGVIFGSGYVRFVSAVSQWGRDTGIDSMLSNYPLLIQGSNVAFGGNDDPKQGSKGNRSFVANKGNTVYIGVVHNATVAESARVLKALGMENGLNLDSGGSTALWNGGYKLGPGRDIPNAILFIRK